jgi:thiamine biosynthesis protein ThiS
MIVRANGKMKTLPEGTTLEQFLEQAGLPAERIVVEHNGEPRRRQEFAKVVLRAGDTLEIAQMVGGG